MYIVYTQHLTSKQTIDHQLPAGGRIRADFSRDLNANQMPRFDRCERHLISAKPALASNLRLHDSSVCPGLLQRFSAVLDATWAVSPGNDWQHIPNSAALGWFNNGFLSSSLTILHWMLCLFGSRLVNETPASVRGGRLLARSTIPSRTPG